MILGKVTLLILPRCASFLCVALLAFFILCIPYFHWGVLYHNWHLRGSLIACRPGLVQGCKALNGVG